MADMDMDVDATEEAAEDSGEGKKKLPLKLIIIIVLALVILGGGGFFGWQFFMAGDEEAAQETAESGEAGEKAEGKADEKGEGEKKGITIPGTVLDLQPFIVNLADPAGKRYLKLKLAIDAKDEKLKQEIEVRVPQIRDSILLLLTSKSYADIAPVAGKIRLRNEILKIINRSLTGVGSVHAVYFTEFVVQ